VSAPRLLILGRNGQVGWELQRALAPLGEIIALDRHSDPCGNLEDLEGLRGTMRRLKPQVIINAAAHTAVDKAEGEPDLAWRLNAEAPGVLAHAAREIGAFFVHYSTDYVFDGSGETSWRESDPTGPLGVYGASKLAGEQRVAESGASYLIFRTSWVYAARGNNFAKTMLKLARERERLTVINDQFGAPTGAELIADVTAHALRQALGNGGPVGIYHLAAAGVTHWQDYAKFVIETARRRRPDDGWKVAAIDPVPTSAWPTPARRPANSRLDTRLLESTFGLHLPPWQHGVARMLEEILQA
jgi:dTDP-4-dehydrorhamnose reductase